MVDSQLLELMFVQMSLDVLLLSVTRGSVDAPAATHEASVLKGISVVINNNANDAN